MTSVERWRSRTRAAMLALEPLFLFVGIYAGLLWLVARLAWFTGMIGFHQWGLLAAILATTFVVWRDAAARAHIRSRLSLRDGGRAVALCAGVVSAAALLVLLSRRVEYRIEGSFPVELVLLLMLPAAAHEELVFRGAGFDALRSFGDRTALVMAAALFTTLHIANAGVSVLALSNIFLGGLLLGLARIRWGLAAAIAGHFAWNVTSGPVLGHGVSGWRLPEALLRANAEEPWWWSGGSFGLEGGLAMTVVLLCCVIALERARFVAARDKIRPLSDGGHSPRTAEETGLR